MNCPKCYNQNDDTNVFCINCGETFLGSSNLPPTLLSTQNVPETVLPTQVFEPSVHQNNEYLSDPTVFAARPQIDQTNADHNQSNVNFNDSRTNVNPSMVEFNPAIPFVVPQRQTKSRIGLWLGLGVLLAILLSGGIVIAVLLFYKPVTSTETLPDNANLISETNVSVKNKINSKNTNSETKSPTPTPKPTVAPPIGSRTGYADTNNVVVRAAPSLDAQKVSGLKRGQKIYVLGFSNNYDNWNGLEGNWANVQTETGQRGWVFSPLIRY
jgi:hypothetical protein